MATEPKSRTARPYRKRARAQQEEQTRQRITEAAMRLHGSIGPAYTTVSDVAREAGVQRATVYRHFPTQEDLFAACSGHYVVLHPPPNFAAWGAITDPHDRLQTALAEIYGYWEETESMFEKVTRDAGALPAMKGPREANRAYRAAAVDAIVGGRPERGKARTRVRAAVGHAITFPTWQSLRRAEGLAQGEAVALMVAMVESAGRARARQS